MTQSQPYELLRKKHYNATITHIIPCHPHLWRIHVTPDNGVDNFLPGQYTTLGLGYWENRCPEVPDDNPPPEKKEKLLRRAYSLSHPIWNMEADRLFSADQMDYYEFYINLVTQTAEGKPPAAFTPRLFNLKPGDRIAIGKKILGRYTLEQIQWTNDTQFLFLGTGTGEGPHNYLIWELLSKNFNGKILSAVSVRYRNDLGYLSMHSRLAQVRKDYYYYPLVTREKAAGEKKYLQQLVEEGFFKTKYGFELDPQNTHVFLCGSPAMIGLPKTVAGQKEYPTPKGVIEVLENLGFTMDTPQQPGNIHFESYW